MIAVASVTVATTMAVTLKSHTWQASALTQVKTKDVAAQITDEQPSTMISPAQEHVERFNILLKDNLPGGFVDTALRRADLSSPINVDPKADDPRALMLMRGLSVSTSSDTSFMISATWSNPRECERIVRALQSQYIDEVGLERSAPSTAGVRFLDGQIANYDARMRSAEAGLVNFNEQSTGHLSAVQDAKITQLSNLEARRDGLLITQKDAALKISTLQDRLKTVSPFVQEQDIAQSPLVKQLLELRAQRDTMLAKYKPNHPNVLALDEQIKNLEQDEAEKARSHAPEAMKVVGTRRHDSDVYIALQQQLTDAKIAFATQQSQLDVVDNLISQYRSIAREMPGQRRELDDRTRDYSLIKDRYETLLKKRAEVEMQGAIDKVSASSTLTPIGWIYAEPSMTRTKILVVGAGSLMLGLIVATLLLLMNEWSDRSLRYPADVERLLGVPVLAMLPENAKQRKQAGPTTDRHDRTPSRTQGVTRLAAPPSRTSTRSTEGRAEKTGQVDG